MRRREFLGLVGGAATWPLAAHGQQDRVRPLIGWLGGSTREAANRNHDAFLQGLREYGYEDGNTINVVHRWADGDLSRLPALAKELVALNPRVIVSAAVSNNIALMQTTADIPIVGALTSDPVKLGHAVSYNRPGRNFTGVLISVDGLRAKQAELLLQLLPRATSLGVLLNPNSATNSASLIEIVSSLRSTSFKVVEARAVSPADLPAAFETFKQQKADGIVVLPDNMLFSEANRILALATSQKMPAIHSFRQHVEQGGLMSYGVSVPQNFRRTAYFVDRILKGASPGDLPIELPTKLELVINLKTAKALGIEVPSKLLFTADEVIE